MCRATIRGTCTRGRDMILELLRGRFSVRSFQKKPIAAGILQDMLEAGRLSPSGGNEQAWRFGLITNPSIIAQVAEVGTGDGMELGRSPECK